LIPAIELVALAEQCAPAVHVVTAKALIRQESGGNPNAIGVVGGRLERQPRSRSEALATVRALEAAGWNYSVGLAQINRANFGRLGLTPEAAFDPCTNLRAMQAVLHECWARAQARPEGRDARWAVEASLACYYSGSFAVARHGGYVDSVVANARSVRTALNRTVANDAAPTAR
jgi:type IV secretion system protein VirB1